jgi:hypothetical protein
MNEALGQQQWDALRELFHDTTEMTRPRHPKEPREKEAG